MNQYAEGDLNILLDRFWSKVNLDLIPKGGGKDIMIAITIQRVETYILWDTLLKIVLDSNHFVSSGLIPLPKDYCLLFNFIHYFPFDSVPLYINEMPEVARWRLEVGT